MVKEHLGEQAVVTFAHMELATPSLPETIDRCVREGATHVFVQPLFLARGRHATIDIPELVAEARKRHVQVRFSLGRVVGADPVLAALIAERARAALEVDSTP